MKKIVLALIAFAFILECSAQQISLYSQYMQNKYAVNPAVAGTTPYNPITLSYKQFWTGINGGNNIQSLSSHMAISENVGVGGKLYKYAVGPEEKIGIEGTYSYILPIGTGGNKISFGLSGLLYQYHLNKDMITLEDQDDEAVMNSSEKLIVPDASFGTYFYSDNYYAGIAIQQLFNRKVSLMNKDELDQRQVRHYMLHGGYSYIIDDKFSVEPSVLLKFIEAGSMQIDINAKVTYMQMLWAGISYRTSDAVVAMFGVSKKRFEFGYAYDILMGDIKSYSGGSHELMFRYKISSSKPKL